MASRAVFITGATGKQGGAVINALLRENAPFEILALTRNAQSSSAQKLAQKSPRIKLITGNMDAIEDAFQKSKEATRLPIWGVFSVQVPMGDGQSSKSEERQGKALVDAALQNGVQHFVYSSVDRHGSKSDTNPTNIPHFLSKHNIEQHLFATAKRSEMDWTVLRPVAFYENLMPGFFGKVFATSFEMSLREDQKLQMVATSDIGDFAARAFINPEEYKNKSISLAGDELTFSEFKRTFEETTGQSLPKTTTLIAKPLHWMAKELGYMFKWFRDVGYAADIQSLRKINPDLKTFKTWLQTESAWRK